MPHLEYHRHIVLASACVRALSAHSPAARCRRTRAALPAAFLCRYLAARLPPRSPRLPRSTATSTRARAIKRAARRACAPLPRAFLLPVLRARTALYAARIPATTLSPCAHTVCRHSTAQCAARRSGAWRVCNVRRGSSGGGMYMLIAARAFARIVLLANSMDCLAVLSLSTRVAVRQPLSGSARAAAAINNERGKQYDVTATNNGKHNVL